jgi:hypothetical protein
MRTIVPTAAAALLLAAACNGKPEKEQAPAPPAPPAAESPEEAGTVDEKIPRQSTSFTCECVCKKPGCACRPIRSGACVCVDEEYNDCPCICEGRQVASLKDMVGQSTEPGVTDASQRPPGSGPPAPPDYDKRGPPPPPAGDHEMETPDLIHEGFELDPDKNKAGD